MNKISKTEKKKKNRVKAKIAFILFLKGLVKIGSKK